MQNTRRLPAVQALDRLPLFGGTPLIRSYKGTWPKLGVGAYVDLSAQVIGDVELGDHASVWMNAVLRGDVNAIRIGSHTNVQDNCVVHCTAEQRTILEDHVTVGHSVTLHGCRIGPYVLIGIGAIVLNGADVGRESIVAAGTLVPEGMTVPPRSLVMGVPGKVRREVTEAERAHLRELAGELRGVQGDLPPRDGRPAMTIKAVAGTRDILPEEIPAWRRIEDAAHRLLPRYGYREIRTPVFEETELFARGIGGETDIVAKEMYTFEDRDGSSLTLRPEATAGIVRSVIENHLFQSDPALKVYALGPMFRRERPQKGRYRQFHQVDVEAFGLANPPGGRGGGGGRGRLPGGLRNRRVRGRAELRRATRPAVPPTWRRCAQALRANLHRLGPDSQRRTETNPLRVLDSKVPEEQELIAGLPRILEHLCPACRDHFAEVRRQLDLLGIRYRVDHRLVRGLDYYTRTTFEVTSGALGAQNSLLGGGRYDGLVKELGGPDLTGIGFAAGMERIVLAMPAGGRGAPRRRVPAAPGRRRARRGPAPPAVAAPGGRARAPRSRGTELQVAHEARGQAGGALRRHPRRGGDEEGRVDGPGHGGLHAGGRGRGPRGRAPQGEDRWLRPWATSRAPTTAGRSARSTWGRR